MKLEPHKFQQRCAEFGVANACAGFFLDPGLGKTVVMYMIFCMLKKMRLARRMLVACPLRPMFSTWPAEAKKWDPFKHLKVGVLHGPCKSSVLLDESIDVHVINPEGLKWLAKTLEGLGTDPSSLWDILCVDESTKFKHTDTDRFKIVKPMLEGFGRRYILTGSPAPNGLLDLFGQVYILDGGASLGRYITHYRAEYFDQDYSGFGYVPKYNAEARIYEKLRPLVIRMSQEDYLEMPPLVGACGYGEPLVRVVELPEEARKVYDKMERHLITELEDDTVTAANAAAASNKCRQIANGGLYGSAPLKQHPNERGVYDLHEVKVDAVEEIIEELQGVPALVAYEYEHDLDRLRRRFPKAPWIGGGVSATRFADIERAWNQGQIPILLAQPQSVAHGLNLQATRAAVIWHSLTWDLETYEQFIRRVWRQGQKERVFVHHVIAKDTIDEVVLKALQKKDTTQRALLNALKEAYT
jgi:SNF2 family DNA or RNA helicase